MKNKAQKSIKINFYFIKTKVNQDLQSNFVIFISSLLSWVFIGLNSNNGIKKLTGEIRSLQSSHSH